MSILSLWQPILLSGIVTFIAGAIIWMVMPWHKSDFNPIKDEDGARKALQGLSPGTYNLPYCIDQKQLADDPALQAKYKEGPVAFITVLPDGIPAMGGRLIINLIYNLAVAVVAAYLLSRTVPADANYLTNFRVSGTVAFVAYSMAYVQENIWFGRPWSMTAKNFLDALIYGALVGGVFGWLA